MKKNIRLIVICCIAAAILAGLLVILKITAPEQEEETDGEEITSQLLFDKNPTDIEQLTVENEHGSYDIYRFGEGDEAVWGIVELANLPMDGTVITKLVENAATATAQKTVAENPEDISIYGLDDPAARVTAKYSDSAQTKMTFLVGNDTPTGNMHYYMIEGQNTVYAVLNSTVTCYFENKYSTIARAVYSAKTAADENDATDYTRINKITIRRPDLDYDFVIEYDTRLDDEDSMVANSSNHVITSPVFRELNPEKSAEVTDGLFSMQATDLAVVNPNSEDYATCGITEPSAEVTFEINGGDVVNLKIGNEYFNEEGKKAGRFAAVDGYEIIYIFDEISLPWLDVMPLDIVTTMFTGSYVYNLESVDITGENADMHFTVTGGDADSFAVKRDGADTDSDKFKTLYQFILRAPSDELYFEDTVAEPILSVSIKTKDGGGDLIEFIPSDSRKAIIKLNGKSTYKCAAAYVDRLVKNLELYENGEDIVNNW